MPKGFSEREKEIIRNKLLEKGKELLAIYGVRKTSVEDLTKGVGISKGAFYVFYHSKEELFFEIYEGLEKEMKENVVSNLFQPERSPKDSFGNLLKNLILTVDSSPILKNIKKEDLEYLIRKLPADRVQSHFESDDNAVMGLFENFKDSGFLKEKDTMVVSGILRALFFLIFHKEEIGVEIYPEVISAYVDMIADYLIKDQIN